MAKPLKNNNPNCYSRKQFMKTSIQSLKVTAVLVLWKCCFIKQLGQLLQQLTVRRGSLIIVKLQVHSIMNFI